MIKIGHNDNVWDVDSENGVCVVVMPNGLKMSYPSKVSIETLKAAMKDSGLKKFTVKDTDGNEVPVRDFPYEGTLHIGEYNEAQEAT